jgi:hypothetical protein
MNIGYVVMALVALFLLVKITDHIILWQWIRVLQDDFYEQIKEICKSGKCKEGEILNFYYDCSIIDFSFFSKRKLKQAKEDLEELLKKMDDLIEKTKGREV